MKSLSVIALPLLALASAWSADPASQPMAEIEARFVKATKAQMAAAIHLPPEQAGNLSGFAGNLNRKAHQEALDKLKHSGAELVADLRTVVLLGRSSQVDTVRELRYPSEYDRRSDGRVVPTSFETKNIGTELECTLVAADVEMVTLKIGFSVTKFEGFVDSTSPKKGKKLPLAEALRQPLKAGATWEPVFTALRFDSEFPIPADSAALFSAQPQTASGTPPPDDEPQVFVFLTARFLPPR